MSQFYPLKLSGLRRDTADSLVLTLDVPHEHRARFAHRAGQHLTLRILVDGEEVRRSYSLCNAAGDAPLQLAIKKIAGGRFSEWAHRQLSEGDTLDAMAPMGSFGLPAEPQARRHYAAFAAGSGITPILSILETALRDEPLSRFTLIYCNRDLASTQFRERLCELKDRYLARLSVLYLFSNEPQDVELFSGRLDQARCAALLQSCLPASTIDHAYLCGPAGMMDAAAAALLEAGLPAERIRSERFAAAQSAAAPRRAAASSGEGVELTVQLDGARRRLTLPASDDTLLDGMLKAGLAPRYSCKAGVCATCRCKVLAGEVDMEAPHALDPAEVAAGYVLSCRSRARSPRLELAFD
ncbi:2Fe-2S iron-sulfur cluster-binding protein [Chromobacterium alticapitis]|uniref:Phenylacetic acid degradation protein n=1 Tax=Chromobacterium alticapitis TaxID=2073169 RepID=A0A2S5DJQ1_9NEIS|nr:2Fe-2S iron-sulfur cluster-binding protein [Chromobacterium alticapitis]POZ63222.1 phenylacetic acid degradation protein [Chromobacterium alticapitis]